MNGGIHLHLRKRISKGLEPYPSPKWWKRLLDHAMYGVAFISPFALLPQVLQLYESGETSGLSIITWSLFFMVNTLWGIYGVVHRDWPLIISGISVAALDVSIVIGILMYR